MCSINWWTWRCLATSTGRNGSASGVAGSVFRSAVSSGPWSGFWLGDTRKAPEGAFSVLHVGVVRTTSTFRRHPGDVLGRVLDIAGLAVHAVLRVDLEALAAVVVGHYFVDARRAVALGRFVVHRQVLLDRDARVGQLEMNRLFFFMVGIG